MALISPHFRIFSIIIVALSVFGCASPTVISNIDNSVDFSAYRSYGFFETLATDKENYESMESNILKVAVAKQLERRGLVYAENPDLLVNFYINTEEKIRSRSTPTMGGGYYGYRDPYYDTWGGYGGTETRIEQYTQGTLNIDFVDSQRKSLVWEGSVSGRITEKVLKNLSTEIEKAVDDIFSAFPVPPLDAVNVN
jgi:hypothetical protein